MQKKSVVRSTDQERSERQSVIKKLSSWLNIAGNELSSMTRQCVSGRRFADVPTLRAETGAWSTDVNDTQRDVDWPMKVDDARTKLASDYPTVEL